MAGTKTEVRPGVWQLRVYAGRRPNGTPIQIRRTLDTTDGNPNAKPGSGSRRADKELAKMVADVAAGRLTAHTTTVAQLLERWLAHLETLGRSPTTMKEYRSIASRTVIPAIGSVRLDKLTAARLDALYAGLTEKGRSPTTVRHVHTFIGAALHQAERWGLVEKNVSKLATPPPMRQAPVKAPSPDEVRAILGVAEQMDPSLARMLLVAALTGCRRGELCGLRWGDLDTTSSTLTVTRSVYQTDGGGWETKGTKTHQERRIGLDALAIETFQVQREWVDDLAAQLNLTPEENGFIFSPSPVGAEPYRPDVLSHFMGRAAKKAGVKTHLHALRHFSATQGIASGTDVVTMAGRLGHRDPSVTLRVYSHVLEQRDRDVAAAIGASLRRPSS
jgi:integrase